MVEEPNMVRTSVVLPEDLWLKAKALAAEQRSDLRALIIEGLKKVLTERRPKTVKGRVFRDSRAYNAGASLRSRRPKKEGK
jgi:hypothetical protein